MDHWREILQVLWRRKLRTLLTALSVSWGIFMLVVLLGAGNGLATGAEQEFARDATNGIWVRPGRLSQPHQGNPLGKPVRLRNEDFRVAEGTVAIADRISARVGVAGSIVARRAGRQGGFEVRGVHPDHEYIEKNNVVAGRYVNPVDVDERRKVAVIGRKVKETLFAPGEEPLGAEIQVGVATLRVVGVFDDQNEESEQKTIYVPISTAQLVWGAGERIDSIMFTVGRATAAEGRAAIDELRRTLAARHGFSPGDRRAVHVWNSQEMAERFAGLFQGIRTFIWIIGLGTILAGVVGVSNIMLISVQERTREIGIRKAVGAPPASIVSMIVTEALLLTLVSGYLGLVGGVGTLALAQRLLPPTPFFSRPDVDLSVALGATGVLVLAGVLAGLFPALRAARINPIAALRVE